MEGSEQQMPAAEMERMMKAQEVILNAAAWKLKLWETAEMMGVTDRTMRERMGKSARTSVTDRSWPSAFNKFWAATET